MEQMKSAKVVGFAIGIPKSEAQGGTDQMAGGKNEQIDHTTT